MMFSAFPDFTVTLEDLHKVVARLKWTGTQENEFMGMPVTGKSFAINVIDIFRIEDGKVKEHWGVSDMMARMGQLGMLPEPGQ